MRLQAFSSPIASLTFALGLAGASGWQFPATAQLPECEPPAPGEYLLLVVSETEDDPEIVRQLLAPPLQAQVCSYLEEVVVRVEGFKSQEEASGLARSITQEVGLAAFVTRPPSGTPETAPPAPSTASTPTPATTTPTTPSSGFLDLPRVEIIEARPASDGTTSTSSTASTENEEDEAEFQVALDRDRSTSDLPPANLSDSSFEIPSSDNDIDTSELPVYVPVPQSSVPYTFPTATTTTLPTTAYNPQTLAPGYAVLVDYFNQTQVAAQVQQLTSQSVGLVSYGQRPFLLVGYTSNEAEANQLLQRLSASGFWAMVVDSQRVMVIAPQVAVY